MKLQCSDKSKLVHTSVCLVVCFLLEESCRRIGGKESLDVINLYPTLSNLPYM